MTQEFMKDLSVSSIESTENQKTTSEVFDDQLDSAIHRSRTFLLSQQKEEGYWVAELESNATITAELIFFMHFTGTVDLDTQAKMVNYLLRKQREDGSWSLFFEGPCDINSTV